MNTHVNQFDFLRIFGAFLVFFSHSYALANLPEPWVFGTMSAGGLGVAIFFSISGFLTTKSIIADPNPFAFSGKRILRIFPALIAVSVISALVIGPAVSATPLSTYFSSSRPYSYILNNIFLSPQFDLPGIFLKNHFPLSMNGSLWTLPLECLCYILLLLLFHLTPKRHRKAFWVFYILLFTTLATLTPIGVHIFYSSDLYQCFYHAPYFFIASFFALFETPPLDIHYFRNLSFFAAAAVLSAWNTTAMHYVCWFAIPIVTIFLGLNQPFLSREITRHGDLSYGIYLWSFPIQQISIESLAPRIGFPLSMIAAFASVLVISKLSWEFIEKPALALKSLLPHRIAKSSSVL